MRAVPRPSQEDLADAAVARTRTRRWRGPGRLPTLAKGGTACSRNDGAQHLREIRAAATAIQVLADWAFPVQRRGGAARTGARDSRTQPSGDHSEPRTTLFLFGTYYRPARLARTLRTFLLGPQRRWTAPPRWG